MSFLYRSYSILQCLAQFYVVTLGSICCIPKLVKVVDVVFV